MCLFLGAVRLPPLPTNDELHFLTPDFNTRALIDMTLSLLHFLKLTLSHKKVSGRSSPR